MDEHQWVVAKVIRAAGSRLSILSDKALVEMWGVYSCTTGNRFWKPCSPDEVGCFVAWASTRKAVGQEIERCESEIKRRKAARSAARGRHQRARFVMAWDGHRIADPRISSNGVRSPEVRHPPNEPLMTVHELTDSINRWCTEQGIAPTTHGSKRMVDESMVRYCCKYSLMDRPGSPTDGRSRGFSQKHACQLRVIRLLQARSLSMSDINTIMHARPLPELLEIEREELATLKGWPLAEEHQAPRPRHGSPRWA